MFKKISLLGFFISTVFTSLVLSADIPENSGPLTIFFLHGLGGDTTTFGEMPQTVEKEFKHFNVKIKILQYDTNSETKAQFMFVDEIAPQMAAHYKENGLSLTRDPYVIVAHSQGGMIARNFLSTCLRPVGTSAAMGTGKFSKFVRDCRVLNPLEPPVPTNIKMLITLGSPHWGSPVGNRASSHYILSWLGGARYSQDKSLAIGSTRMNTDRSAIIRSQKNWKKLEQTTRFFLPEESFKFVSIAGNIKNDFHRVGNPIRYYLESIASSDISEDDAIVPLTMGNPNFQYYVESETVLPEDKQLMVLNVEQGYSESTSEVYAVPYPHVALDGPGVFKSVSFNGIAQPLNFDLTQKVRVDKGGLKTYPHIPTIYVLREIAKFFNDEERTGVFQSIIQEAEAGTSTAKVQGFSSEVSIQFPVSMNRAIDMTNIASDIGQYIRITQESLGSTDEGTIEQMSLPNSIGFKNYGLNTADYDNKIPSGKQYFSFFHSGLFHKKDVSDYGRANKRAKICYQINIPGFLQKAFCNIVRPGEMSYAKVIMVPFRPFPATHKLTQENPLLLSDATMLVGYDPRTDQGLTVQMDSSSIFQARPWKEIEKVLVSDNVKKNPDVLPLLKKQCYESVAGLQKKFYKGPIYDSPVLEEISKNINGDLMYLRPTEFLQVVGRYISQKTRTERYLVIMGTNQFKWVNAADIDIFEKPCR